MNESRRKAAKQLGIKKEGMAMEIEQLCSDAFIRDDGSQNAALEAWRAILLTWTAGKFKAKVEIQKQRKKGEHVID